MLSSSITGSSRIATSLIPLVSLIAILSTGTTELVRSNRGHKNDESSKAFVPVEEKLAINNATRNVNVVVGCGGIIDFPDAQNSLVIDYKLGVTYDNNERCVWTFNQAVNSFQFRWYYMTVDVTLLNDGFEENYDFLKVLKWTQYGGILTSTSLKNQVTTRLNGVDAMFLSFSSDESNVGTGFRLLLEVITNSINPYYFAQNFLFSSSSTRYLTYSSDHADNVVSAVINPTSPSRPFTFQIDSLNTSYYSSGSAGCPAQLAVYEIQQKAFVQRLRFCGIFTVPLASFDTTDPIIAVFWTTTYHNITGFKYSW